jgi:hypothetical protein
MTAMGESEAEVLAWCVVANVAEQTTFGEDAEPHRGLKHFSAGAKLWVLPPQWGDGGTRVFVVGRHRGRGPGKLVRMVVERRHLTNFRMRGIYSQAVHLELTKPWERWGDHPLSLWDTRESAEAAAQQWQQVSGGTPEVRRPGRRIELLEDLSALANGWRHTARAIAALDPRYRIGDVLRDDREAEAVAAMITLLTPLIADLRAGHPQACCAEDPRWTVVVDAAAKALATMTG